MFKDLINTAAGPTRASANLALCALFNGVVISDEGIERGGIKQPLREVGWEEG
jgi:hypothetical protein